MAEDETIRKESNPQLWIFNAVNKALIARSENPSGFHHSAAGAWCSLHPKMKEKLIKKFDDLLPDLSPKEIRDFDEEGFETSYDLYACLKSQFEGKREKKRIKSGEVILTKIMEVMDDMDILSAQKAEKVDRGI